MNLTEFNLNPIQELKSSFEREGHRAYSKFSSWQGHTVCMFRCFLHAINIVFRPIIYTILTIVGLAATCFKFISCNPEWKAEGKEALLTSFLIIVSPIGQIVKMTQAFFGIFHPGVYYKPRQ